MIENHNQSQAVSNAMVIAAFIAGAHAHAANLSTDGKVLRSYHYYEIAKWTSKHFVTLRAGELYSKTTTKHLNLLRKALENAKVDCGESTVDTPRDEPEANFSALDKRGAIEAYLYPDKERGTE